MKHLFLRPLALFFARLFASAQVPTPADKGEPSQKQVQKAAGQQSGADFDIRHRQRANTSQVAGGAKAQDRALIRRRKAKLEAYRASVAAEGAQGLRLSINTFGLPKSLSNAVEPLSGPSTGDPVEVAKGFLRTREDLFLLGEDDIEGLRLVSRDAASSGLMFLHFTQTVGGIDVYQGHVKVTLNAAGQVIQAGVGDLIPRLQLTTKPVLSARDAVLAAFRFLGLDPPAELEPLPSPQTRYTYFRNPASDQYNPIRVELSIVPLTATSARLAYRLFLEVAGRSAYEIVVDAQDGRLLYRQSLLESIGQARVWRESPDAGDRELVEFPEGWLPPGGTVTTGNNVDAFRDADSDTEPDSDPFPDSQNGRAASVSQVFDFPAGEDTTNQDPTDFPVASVTNLFYYANVAHDYFYDLGFTETAGNFQTDNFARGGQGLDAVRAAAQVSVLSNNATFVFMPEGLSPLMGLGIYDGTMLSEPTDDLDAAYDGGIVMHEYGHGVTTRIVGGPEDVGCLRGTQSRGMGEGWSDYFDTSFYDDAVHAEYVTQNTSSGSRRQSYEGYTFTYEDLGNEGFEVHNDGEIWAGTLWDLRSELGQETTDQLVMDGLKLTPCNPNMIDARDAILTAQEATKGAATRATLWEVFARHGLGHSASGFDGTVLEGTVYTAAFDLPPDLQPGNGNPMITSQPTLVPGLGDVYVYDIDATDPDGDTLNYELTEGPDGMTVDPTTGLVQWTASFTEQRVEVTVTDGNGGRVIQGFRIPTLTRLTPGRAVTIEGPQGSLGPAEFEVPAGTLVLQVRLRGGTGDADFVLTGPDGLLRVSAGLDTTETFSVSSPQPGLWALVVIAASTYADVSLETSFPVPTLIDANGEWTNLSGEETSETFYRVVVPRGITSFTIETSGGSGDVDLFVKKDQVAVCSGFGALIFGLCEFDELSLELDNDEMIEINDPAPGDWFIDLFGADAYSGVTLKTVATLGDAPLLSG